MLTAAMFEGFAATLTGDLITVIPIAIGVMGTLWGVRTAINYFKGIAR